MDLDNMINLFVNNGVAVAVIIYFMLRDVKFMASLVTSIQELKDSINNISKNIQERGEK